MSSSTMKHRKSTDKDAERQPEVFGPSEAEGREFGPDSQAKHAGSKKGSGAIVEEGDGMMVFSVDQAELDAARVRQENRILLVERMSRLAMERFQSILRKRDAGETLARGFSQAATKQVQSWFKKNLQKASAKILDVEDLMSKTFKVGLQDLPIAGTIIDVVNDGVSGEAAAAQKAAELEAVDKLISSMEQAITATSDAARAKLRNANGQQLINLDAATDYSTPAMTEADIDELIAKLDALLSRAIFDSGTLTSREYLDRLKDRKHLERELDAARERFPSEGAQ